MSDVDRYLIQSERPVVLTRRHWASMIRPAAIASGWSVLALLILIYLSAAQIMTVAGLLLLFGAIGWFGWQLLDWHGEEFVITDKRVLLISGLLTRRVAIMPLGKVTDLTYERSVTGRILGYGVFVIESAGQQQALSRIDYLPTPERLYHDVSTLLFGPRPGGRSGPPAGGSRPGPAAGDNPTTPLPRLR